MAKYASQPTLPTSPAFGAQPNNFSTLAPHRLGQALPALGAVPGAANPYATSPQAAVGAPATAQGIMQTAQQAKTAGLLDEAPVGGSVAALGMGKTPGRFAGDARPSLLRRWPCTKEAAELGRFVADLDVASILTGLPVSRLDASPYLDSARFRKTAAAMAPATAAPPAAPPPMPTPLGVQGMLPPGATPPGGPGAAPAPGAPPADPNAPPAENAMPGAAGDPAAAGAPPPTLNGEVPPMGMPPTPPLPANPRVNPPRQATPQDFQRRQDLNQLLMMDEQASPENTVQSMQPDLLTMGSKSAFENFYAKCAASPLDDPELHARVDAMAPQVRNVFDRFQDVFADIWEKCAAQDNGPDQHAVQRSATGESKGLSYQHKPDHYMQGQDAWDSVSGYFKGGEKKKPNPFLGKHAADESNFLTRDELLTMKPSVLGRTFSLGNGFNRTVFDKAGSGDEIAFKYYKSLGHSDEEADRLAGQPVEKQAGEAVRRSGESREQWLERLALPEELFKQASMPNMGKGNAPQLKPGFDLKPPVAQLPYSPGAGVLQMNKNFLQLLKPPVTPPKLPTPKTAEDVFEKAAAGWRDLGTAGLKQVGRWFGSTADDAMRGAAKAAPQASKYVDDTVSGAGFTMKSPPGTARAGASPYASAAPTSSAASPSMWAQARAGLNTPYAVKHLIKNVGMSAGGALAGGFTGDGSGEGTIGVGGVNGPFDWWRAAAGAIAFNPTLNRYGHRGLAPAMSAVRGNIGGNYAGMAGDYIADSFGYDTGGALRQAGGALGTGLGATRGTASLLRRMPNAGPMRPALSKVQAMATKALKPMTDFGDATDDLGMSALTYLPRQFGRNMRKYVPQGGRVSNMLDDFNVPQYVPGQKMPFFSAPAKNLAGYLGRTAGGAATAVGGAAGTYALGEHLLRHNVAKGVERGGKQLYENVRPQMAADLANVADTYLNDAGLLDEQGKVQVPMPQVGGKLMGMADGIFRQLGMNPDQMSPAQKISILGGTGLLGAGALSGNGGLAGVGGMMMGGGAMMGGEQSPLMQLLRHMPRNEYMTQLQQTGQAPNANPYGPTL